MVFLKVPEEENLDLGRPLTFDDIKDGSVMPMDEQDSGCYCYQCQQGLSNIDALQPLTPSTGVLTTKVRCSMDAPVWVCLEHLPHYQDRFEAFTDTVADELRAAQAARDGKARKPRV